ncbi:hypothetical protein EXN66_Car015966 [Channa argus]|uniref:Uncharacterized protein n=1 Tax=Channa argus TaxID=215402 RepID=A0A6G1QCZ7_CHAAH|nr:hypothetical protein EXN66_Car015966 [Channa argus]
MYKWMQKLRAHSFIPLRHHFLSLGPFLQIAAGHTHPPSLPTKAKARVPDPHLLSSVCSFYPCAFLHLFLNPSIRPSVHLAFSYST